MMHVFEKELAVALDDLRDKIIPILKHAGKVGKCFGELLAFLVSHKRYQ